MQLNAVAVRRALCCDRVLTAAAFQPVEGVALLLHGFDRVRGRVGNRGPNRQRRDERQKNCLHGLVLALAGICFRQYSATISELPYAPLRPNIKSALWLPGVRIAVDLESRY